jgi:hypothetical protein
MARMRKKSDLPQKTCLTCKRPFNWRKKWEKVWDEVKYCSQRCKDTRNARPGATGGQKI